MLGQGMAAGMHTGVAGAQDWAQARTGSCIDNAKMTSTKSPRVHS
jgi:hypothetical protein